MPNRDNKPQQPPQFKGKDERLPSNATVALQRAIVEALNTGPKTAKELAEAPDVKSALLQKIMGEKDPTRATAPSDMADLGELRRATRFLLLHALTKVAKQFPELRDQLSQAAVAFSAFSPDSDDALQRESLRKLGQLAPQAAARLLLLRCAKDPANASDSLRLLEELDHPLQVEAAVRCIRSAHPSRSDVLKECLSEAVRERLEADGVFDRTKRVEFRNYFPRVLEALQMPRQDLQRETVRVFKALGVAEDPALPASPSLDTCMQASVKLAKLFRQEPEYAAVATAAFAAAHHEIVIAQAVKPLFMMLKREAPALCDLLEQHFNAHKGELTGERG